MTPNQLLKNFLPNSFPLSPAQLTGDVNDYQPGTTGGVLRMSSDASRTITGIVARGNAQLLWIINVGSFDIVLANASGSSAAANQILTSTGANITIPPLGVAFVFYDPTTSRWRANLMVGAPSSGGGGGLAIYGDGSDGNVTISSNTSLARDMYYDTLTVDATFTLNAAGFAIYCKTALIVNGTIAGNGGAASGSGGASASPGAQGSTFLSTAGAAGGNGQTGAGQNGTVQSNAFGGSGGAGGAGASGAGGTGGVATPPAAGAGGPETFKAMPFAGLATRKGATAFVLSAAGGGGGGGDGANEGGGAGSGAFGVFIFAKSISGSGALHAIGGAGADGVAGNTGGGGGGGGGIIVTVSEATDAVTRSVAGGAPGNGVGTGGNGVAGSAGRTYSLVNA